jgi:hypothetical protein
MAEEFFDSLEDEPETDSQDAADLAAYEAELAGYEPDADDFERMAEWENEGGLVA